MKKILIIIFVVLVGNYPWMSSRWNVDNGGCVIDDKWISILAWSELDVDFNDCYNRQWFKNLFGWL